MTGKQNTPSAFEMGLVSMVSLLGEISKNTNESLKLLSNLQTKKSEDFNVGGITSFIKNTETILTKKHDLLLSVSRDLITLVEMQNDFNQSFEKIIIDNTLKITTHLDLIAKSLKDLGLNLKNLSDPKVGKLLVNPLDKKKESKESDLKKILQDNDRTITEKFEDVSDIFKTKFEKLFNKKPEKKESSNILDNIGKSLLDSINPTNKPQQAVQIDFTGILTVLQNIEKLVKLISDDLKSQLGKNPKEKEKDKKKSGDKKTGTGFKDFLESVALLKTQVDKTLINNITKFSNNFEKLISFDTAKLKTFGSGLVDFSKNLKIFNIELSSTAKHFDKIMGSFLKFAGGIGILVLSLFVLAQAPFIGIAKMILFIGLLGITLKLFYSGGKLGISTSPPVLTGFALGIGILVLSLFALQEVDWVAPLKLIVFIGLLGMVLKTFNGGKLFGVKFSASNPSPLTSFALGIGILVLSLFAIKEVNWVAVFKLVAFIGILGIVLKLNNSAPKSLVGFALGIGILVIAAWVIKDLPWESMFKLVLFIGAIGLALRLVKKQAAVSLLMLGIGLLGIATAIAIVAVSPITIKKALIFAGSVLIFAAMAIGLGVPVVAGFALLGSAVMVVLGLSALIVAGSLALISVMPIKFEKILQFSLASLLLAGTFALLTPLAIIAAIGATLMIPVALSAIFLSLALLAISKVDYTSVGEFTKSIFKLALVFVAITPLALIAAVGSVLLLPTIITAALIASLLKEISKLEITTKNLDNFNIGLQSVVGAFGNIGVIEAGKTAAKSLLLMPVFASGLIAALTLRAISGLNISETKIESFGRMIGIFVQSISQAINGNIEELKKMEPGLQSLSQLVNIASKLAEVVTAFANMNYNVYEVKNGKLELVAVRKITDKEIEQVGINVGRLIQALLSPLAIISSDSDTWDFGGGIKVENPFASRKSRKRIERLELLGNSLLPLSNAMEKFSNSNILQNETTVLGFKNGLIVVVDTFTQVFGKLETWKNKEAKASISNIGLLAENFEKFVNDEKLKSINDTMTSFLNTLSDEDKWVKINKNLGILNSNLRDIVKNINMINLEKALVLEKNLKLLSEQQTGDSLKLVIEKLEEMIGVLKLESPEKQTTKTVDSGNQILVNKESKEINLDDLKTLLSDISDKIASTNAKLSGKLKVVQISQNSNAL
jgi:hypothetical protein